MGKKIAVLTGSPRKKGSSFAMTDAFIQAAEGAGFEESELWYDHLERHVGWKSLGKVLCGRVTQPGDMKGNPKLQEAYALGKSVV